MTEVAAPPLSRSAVARVGVLSLVGLVALGVARLAHGSMVSRATDPATYGLVGSLIGLAYVGGLFLPAGLASAATKYIAQYRGEGDEARARGAYRLLSRLNAAAATVVGLACAGAARWWFDVGMSGMVAVGALAAAFALYSVDKAAMYGFGRAGDYARLELVGSTLAVLATVAVVIAGWTAYLWPLAIGCLVVAVGARFVLRGRGGTAVVRPNAVMSFAGLAALGSVASAGFLQGVPLLANRFTGAAEVGYLVAAVALVSPLYLLPRVLGLALFPAMAQARGAGDHEAVRRGADVSLRALLVPLAPVFAAALPLAGPVLVLFGGPPYAAGAHVLQLLLVATYVAVVATGPINALSSGGLRDVFRPVGYAVAGCLVGLAAVPLLGARYGAAGIGVAYLLGVGLTSAGPVIAAWYRWRMPWTGPMLRAVAVVAVAFGFAYPIGDSRPWVALVAAVVAFTLGCAVLAKDLLGLRP